MYRAFVARDSGSMRFAERTLRAVGEEGGRDTISIWIERRPGAVWAVGRAINLHERRTPEPRRDDYLFEGYELGDALEAANNALRDDVLISAGDGVNEDVPLFEEEELLKPLERWFFGHR